MIYIGNDIINKIGNSNRLYYNNSIVYQGYYIGDTPDVPDTPTLSLPDVPFMFNYNAKNYVDGVIPNADGALFEYGCTLSKTNVVDYYGDYLTFNADAGMIYNFGSTSNNPFNRIGNDPMTIIMKTRTSDTGTNHLMANRGDYYYGSSYNWMVRIETGYQFLHTLKPSPDTAIAVPYVYDSENIVAIRCLNNGNGYAQNYTTGEIGDITLTDWGGKSGVIGILNGAYGGEIFRGDFYWMYLSNEQLTDEQIQQVIDYNEN